MNDVAEDRIRRALALVRDAYDLVEPLSDLTADDVSNVEMAEEFRSLYESVREYGRCQFGVRVRRRGPKRERGRP